MKILDNFKSMNAKQRRELKAKLKLLTLNIPALLVFSVIFCGLLSIALLH